MNYHLLSRFDLPKSKDEEMAPEQKMDVVPRLEEQTIEFVNL